MTDLEAFLMAAVVWMYFCGLILSITIAAIENYKCDSKTIIGCLLWFLLVPYTCITINKGRGV